MASSNGSSKQKADVCSGPLAFSIVVASPTQVSIIHSDVQKKPHEAGLRQIGRPELAVSEKVDLQTASYTLAIPGHPITYVPTTQYVDPLKDKNDSLNMSHKSEKVDHTSFYTPAILGHPVTSGPSIQSIDSVKDKDESLNMSHNLVNSYDKFDRSRNLGLEREPIPVAETAIKKVCSDMPSLRIDGPRL